MIKRFILTIIKKIRLIRRFFYSEFVKFQCGAHGAGLHVNGKTVVTRNTMLGRNVHFNGMTINGNGNVKIGNNFHSGKGCFIYTQTHNYDSGTAIPYDSSNIIKDVTIEDNVWLGDRVTIMSGVLIEEGAIVQAGSVVVSNISKCSIVGGHPAKEFKKRDIKHYERLKNEGKFH